MGTFWALWSERIALWTAWTLERLSAIIAPPRCSACDTRVRGRSAFCGACASTAERASHRQGPALIAAFVYGGCVARALARLKYEDRPDLGRPLGDLLCRAVRDNQTEDYAAIIPVPLHRTRLIERGYNQSALVASRVAKGLRVPMWTGVLVRTKRTTQQAALDRSERIINVANAFAVKRPDLVAGHSFLLIDDVSTTGATLEACAEALRRAGAEHVGRAVVARTEA